MGMYTDFEFKFYLKKDTPLEIINIIYLLSNYEWDSLQLISKPDHDFFKLKRWDWILNEINTHPDKEYGFYFDEEKQLYYLNSYTSINHGYLEVQEFINWLKDYIVPVNDDGFLGYSDSETGIYSYNLKLIYMIERQLYRICTHEFICNKHNCTYYGFGEYNDPFSDVLYEYEDNVEKYRKDINEFYFGGNK